MGTLYNSELYQYLGGPPVFQVHHLILPDFTLNAMSNMNAVLRKYVMCSREQFSEI